MAFLPSRFVVLLLVYARRLIRPQLIKPDFVLGQGGFIVLDFPGRLLGTKQQREKLSIFIF